MTKSTGMIRDLTRGPVVSQLFRFALPLFISNALQALYNLVDMVVVGNYIGPSGMSAVSIGGVFYFSGGWKKSGLPAE